MSNALLLVAIDLGNTFSGYAYAINSEIQNDQCKIYVPTWIASTGALISSKTPSTILLDMDTKFVAFGFEAESEYTNLLENGDGDDYFYFCHLKMMLYEHAKTKVSE